MLRIFRSSSFDTEGPVCVQSVLIKLLELIYIPKKRKGLNDMRLLVFRLVEYLTQCTCICAQNGFNFYFNILKSIQTRPLISECEGQSMYLVVSIRFCGETTTNTGKHGWVIC